MSIGTLHTTWLSLIDRSGPFLSVQVLETVLPQGLDIIQSKFRTKLRRAYELWQEDIDNGELQEAFHHGWVNLVLKDILEYDDKSLFLNAINEAKYTNEEVGAEYAPKYIVKSPVTNKIRFFIDVLPPDIDFEKAIEGDKWPASLIEKMTLLCRSQKVRYGLLTNGEKWTVVTAPIGATSGSATWYSRLWRYEPVTLKAFQTLLGARRCFGPESETLDTLLDSSLNSYEEVTSTLGEQVRRAVEVLIQSLDSADQDRNRELLEGIPPSELYDASVTVMMRLVFLLCAEERGLLLLGDPTYDQFYAVTTLRAHLAEEAGKLGPEVLERRHDAWSRLLATFRAVYGGIEHETLRLPPLGGSLFDPDKYPFLEGRKAGSSWKDSEASPLPIDNRTALLLLTALQVLEQKGGALHLSYRALDVEQIGHVYEGLLDSTVSRMPELTLGLEANRQGVLVKLSELEELKDKSADALIDFIFDKTNRSKTALQKMLASPVGEEEKAKLYLVTNNETEVNRIIPFYNILRTDIWENPLVYKAGAYAVTIGQERRDSGTHYTPKSLTESIVEATLQPLIYQGCIDGKPRNEWEIKTPSEILDIKVCDPAMGSAAFLVQVCRSLSEALVQSWANEEQKGFKISVLGDISTNNDELIPANTHDRVIFARRIIAEKCLYGIDMNPLAVELAKLSIWLITLSKGKPFGFLDHNLKSGDSLLGLTQFKQLSALSLEESSPEMPLFETAFESSLKRVVSIRSELPKLSTQNIEHIHQMEDLHHESSKMILNYKFIADVIVAQTLLKQDSSQLKAAVISDLSGKIHDSFNDTRTKGLMHDLPSGRKIRTPFHWMLEFPEVFIRNNPGFDVIVGNPPFKGGQMITGILGTSYREYLITTIANGTRGSADLVSYFFLRAFQLLRNHGSLGLLAVNTISEGDTRQVGLEQIVSQGGVIYKAIPNMPWPGQATVSVSQIHIHKGNWSGEKFLGESSVNEISPYLSNRQEFTPKKIKTNSGKSFQGSIVLGMGFVLEPPLAKSLLDNDFKYNKALYPYLNGEDLNSEVNQQATRYVINFWDWPLTRTSEKGWSNAIDEAKENWLKSGTVPLDYPADVATDYPSLYQIIEEKVKPERQRKDDNDAFVLRSPLPERWWQYGEKRPALYHAIGRGHSFVKHPKDWNPEIKLERVLVCSLVSKYLSFVFQSPNQVFAHRLAVFATDRYSDFAFLSSSVNEAWARKNSSSLETRLNYSPSDAYETLPFPDQSFFSEMSNLNTLGKSLESARLTAVTETNLGLTKLYNRFHSPDENSTALIKLREIHSLIDEEVCKAYGWSDLELDYKFREVSYLPETDRLRFAMSNEARDEILVRLSKLNFEYTKGESEKKTKKVSKSKSKKSKDQQENGLEERE